MQAMDGFGQRGWRAFAGAIMLVLAGCGGEGPAAQGDGAAPSPLAITRDPARAVEATIGVAGGRLEASAADGTRYVLEVPAGALPGDTRIRAVPASLSPPAADASHALMFEPDGLRFLDWVRLTIVPATPVPAERRFPFWISEDGAVVAAALVDPSAEATTLLLDHFSGYGLANATDPQRAAMLQRQSAIAAERFQSRIAAALAKASHDGVPIDKVFGQYQDEYEREVLKPLLDAAGGSCEATQAALQAVLGYERQRQQLGVTAPSNIDAKAVMNQALTAADGPCEKEAIAQCKAARDPAILMTFWIGRARQRTLLGMPDDTALGEMLKSARKICIGAQAWEIHGKVPSIPGGTTLDGDACSLEEPFRVRSNDDLIGTMMFTPENAQGGRWSYHGVVGNTPEFAVDGSGRYTASEAEDGQGGEIHFDWRLTVHIPVVGDQTSSLPVTLTLTPAAPCR